MSVLATVADIAIVIAAIPAFTGGIVWTQRQLEARKQRRTDREVRNWNGYIQRAGVSSWFVKIIEDPDNKWTERVVLDVVDQDGTPNPSMAHALRLHANADRLICRYPSASQWDFLKDLEKDRFNTGQGYPIQ
jgi:hypothetical protein